MMWFSLRAEGSTISATCDNPGVMQPFGTPGNNGPSLKPPGPLVRERIRSIWDMSIKLKNIWPIENVVDYKIHFARHNGEVQPLDNWLENNS